MGIVLVPVDRTVVIVVQQFEKLASDLFNVDRHPVVSCLLFVWFVWVTDSVWREKLGGMGEYNGTSHTQFTF